MASSSFCNLKLEDLEVNAEEIGCQMPDARNQTEPGTNWDTQLDLTHPYATSRYKSLQVLGLLGT